MSSFNCSQFNLKLSNLPLINIRSDFNSLLALFRSETFRKQFRGDKGRIIPVKTHYFTWHGTDVKHVNASTEKKTTLSGEKKSKDVPPLDAKKIKAAGGTTSGGDSGKDQDPAKSSASRSKKDHDAAEKVIDNLK